jgi:predicted DCC family thiol-disulfide oxidoreductase YuxK
MTKPHALALLRIIVGVSVLIKAATGYGILSGLLRPGMLRLPLIEGLPLLTREVLPWYAAAWMFSGALLAIGLRTRMAAAMATLFGAYYLAHDQATYSNHLYLLTLLCFLLTVGRSGAFYSVDALAGRDIDKIPAWNTFLIKAQLTIMYLWTAVAKMNAPFLSGAIFERFLVLPKPMYAVMAIATVVVEIFIAIALWTTRFRSAAMVTGFLLHTGIAVTMLVPLLQLWLFGAYTLGMYLVFIDTTPRVIVWDDGCSFCQVWIRWFRRLDWLRIYTFYGASNPGTYAALGISQAEADEAIQVTNPRLSGFDAVVSIASTLPLTAYVAPLLLIPPVPRFGRIAYRRVAARRKCTYTLPPRSLP